jgi:hypothetical protein
MSRRRSRQLPLTFRIICSQDHRRVVVFARAVNGDVIDLVGGFWDAWASGEVAILEAENPTSFGEMMIGRRTWSLECDRCGLRLDRREEHLTELLAGMAWVSQHPKKHVAEVELRTVIRTIEANSS